MTAVRQARAADAAQAPLRELPREAPRPQPVPGWSPRRPGQGVPRPRPGGKRRTRFLVVLTGALVALGMFAVVGAHVVLAQRQFRLDRLSQQLNRVQAQHEQLQLRVTELQSPQRIVSTAKQRLGMVVPPKVVYLTPGHPQGTTKQRGVPAPPAPPAAPQAAAAQPAGGQPPPTTATTPPASSGRPSGR